MRRIADFPFEERLNKVSSRTQPYGDAWDIIWFGHCGMSTKGKTRQYSFNDPATQPKDHEFKIWPSFNNYQHPVGTRAVFQVEEGVCSTGYAISLKGAKKLIEHFKQGDEPIDLKLSHLCRDAYDMLCIGVWPSLVVSAPYDTNMQNNDDLEEWEAAKIAAKPKQISRKGGYSIQVSARINAPAVLEHEAGPDEWKYEYDGAWTTRSDGTRHRVPVNSAGTQHIPQDQRVKAD